MSLKRANRKEFSEYRKLMEVRNYITSCQGVFVAGNEINTDTIFAHFNLAEPDYTDLNAEQVITRYNSYCAKRSKLTKRFNDVLAQFGMHLRKKADEDVWVIKTNERVEARIERLYNNSLEVQREGITLETGYEIHGNAYTRVSNPVLKRIAARTARR